MAEEEAAPDRALATDTAGPETMERPGPLDEELLAEPELSLLRDELRTAQAAPGAARELAARHWARLNYDTTYPWRGQKPYPKAPEK